jgi:hypothetical protein
VVFQEAENRLHVQKAIMVELMKDAAVEVPEVEVKEVKEDEIRVGVPK